VLHRLTGRPCLLLFFFCFCLHPAFAGPAQAKNRLSEIRHWSSPTFTRIVLDLQEEAQSSSDLLHNPERIVVDLRGFDGHMPKNLIRVNDGIVRTVRLFNDGKGKVRLVIDLEKPAAHKLFSLKQIDGKPPRLVVDITRSDLEEADRVRREETRRRKKQGDYIIVVDPGHGGEDPGAVSKRGTKEKDLVLAIGKHLAAQLNGMAGIKAYLTRTSDYFIPLQKRIDIAKEYGADMFISVHVNAGFSKKVSGSSVYCLSFKGASSNAAKIAARRENASDVIGGVPLDQQSRGINAILYDLVQTHTLNSSVQFADLLLKKISAINKLYSPEPQQANFAVLRSLDIPSVLIETDFITTPSRERLLKTSGFKARFAQTVAGAVQTFLADGGKSNTGRNIAYGLGRELETEAPRQASAAVSRPLSENKVSAARVAKKASGSTGDPVPAQFGNYRIVKKSPTAYALVPDTKKALADNGAEGPGRHEAGGGRKQVSRKSDRAVSPAMGQKKHAAPPAFLYHIVRKGETLFSISKAYNMDIDEIRRLNTLSDDGQLKSGTRIKVVKREKG